MHQGALSFLATLKREFKPDRIVQIGDETDAAALSNYESDPDGLSAGSEHCLALAQLKPLYKLFPEVSVCTSNHGSRPFRKAFSAGIPRAYLKPYKEFMEAPAGWNWADSFEIDGCLYIHGEGFSGKDGAVKAAIGHRKSTIIGHIHAFAGITPLAGPHDQIFAMNTGCLIDYSAYVFKYSKHQVNKPVLGAGIIIDGVTPIFIPMPV